MGSDFPVPRTHLPRVEVTPHERQARKMQMERMLLSSLDEYDHFREVEQSRVDANRWKLVGSQEALQLFRERQAGSGNLKTSSVQSFSNSDEDSSSQQAAWEDYAVDGSSASLFAEGKHKVKSMLLVGELKGHMENAIFATITRSNPELALVLTFLNDDIADCAILNEMEGPTPEVPLQFLGYKWLVKRSPGGGRIVKHRDVLYLEYTGLTKNRAGETVGYLLAESVDLPSFPEMTNRNCLRAVQSVALLLRQKSDGVVDVFMTGVVIPAGKILRPLTSILTSPTMFMVAKLMDLAECKRLTKMVLSQRQARDDQLYNRLHRPTSCSLCHQKRKFYNGVSLVDCSVCGQVVCTRCQTHKRVFIAEGLLGRYHRVGCCKTCVLAADRNRAVVDRAPVKMSFSSQLQRQNSSREFNSAERFSSSRPRSSSDSSLVEFDHGAGTQGLRNIAAEAAKQQQQPSDDVPIARIRSGSVDLPSSNRLKGPGITLFPSGTGNLSRSYEPRAFNTTGHDNSNALVLLPQTQLPRNRGGPSVLRANSHQSRELVVAQPGTRRAESPPHFSSSAPGGTYDLRRQMTVAPPMRHTPTTTSTPTDLYARMMELRRVAESTYQTTQQNQVYMQSPPPQRNQRGL